MRRKLDVTASEMLELRRQGYTNKEIAEQLEVAYATVWRYIGKEDERKGRVTCEVSRIDVADTFREQEKALPKVEVISETIAVNGFVFRKECGLLSVLTGVESQYLQIPVDKAEEFAEAWEAAKDYFFRGRV